MLMGVWLVVVNDHAIPLNLIVWATPEINIGLVVILTFVAGCLSGLAMGFNLPEVLKLKRRVTALKQETQQLQQALNDRRQS